MDDNTYELIKSDIYKDLCWFYFEQKDLAHAKMYAERRFSVVRDCRVASKVLGICLLEEFAVDYKGFRFVHEDTEPRDLMIAAECLRICVEEDEEDYLALMGVALASVYLITCRAVTEDPNLFQKIETNASQCLHNLKGRGSSLLLALAFYSFYSSPPFP